MASHNNVVNYDDEELSAYIYQTSHTAKLFREKAAVEALESPPSSHQTQRKSPRLLAIKSIEQDIPTSATINKNTSIEQRAKRKRKLTVLKEDLCTPICLESSRKPNKGCLRYAGGRKRLCSFDGCTNIDQKGGVCVKHGAIVKRCSHEGCTNYVQQGGVCVKHGAILKRCRHEGCNNQAQKGRVCVKHGASIKRCSHEGCTNKVQKGGVCIRHGAIVKRCKYDGCTNCVIREGVCRRHGATARQRSF